MKKSNKFSPEVRERAVRMVQEHRGEYATTTVPAMPSDKTQAVLIAAGSTICQQHADLIGSGTTSDGRAIFTGKRGGKYYHGVGGGRVYIILRRDNCNC